MFRVFQEEKIVTACMLAFFAVSIFLRLLLGLLYQNMIKESDNMAATENRMLKQCKLKFANCYQMSNGVANIPVFVDKFLNRMSLGPFTFETLYHLSGQTMLLSVVAAGAGIYRSIMAGRTLGDILPYYIVSFFGLYLYFSISTVVDVKKKKRILKVNLVDYLENHLSPRIDITRQDIEMLYGDTGTDGRVVTGRISAVGKGRIRQGRRTVELMPIGTRQSGDSRPYMDSSQEIAIRQPVESRLPLEPVQNIYAEKGPDRSMDNPVPQENVSQDSAAVTEEELEALLKEFLTS